MIEPSTFRTYMLDPLVTYKVVPSAAVLRRVLLTGTSWFNQVAPFPVSVAFDSDELSNPTGTGSQFFLIGTAATVLMLAPGQGLYARSIDALPTPLAVHTAHVILDLPIPGEAELTVVRTVRIRPLVAIQMTSTSQRIKRVTVSGNTNTTFFAAEPEALQVPGVTGDAFRTPPGLDDEITFVLAPNQRLYAASGAGPGAMSVGSSDLLTTGDTGLPGTAE